MIVMIMMNVYLSIISFIKLNDTSIWGPVKINNAALTTLERHISQIEKYNPIMCQDGHHMQKRSKSHQSGN